MGEVKVSDFEDAVRREYATPNYLKSRSEILSHYQDTYGARKGKSMLGQKIAGTTDTHSKAYQSAMRGLRSGRESRGSTAATAAKYESVGKSLPVQSYSPKSNTIKVTLTGDQTSGQYKRRANGETVYVAGGSRTRSFTATFSGGDAYQFVNDPTYRTFFKQVNIEYSNELIDRFEDGTYALHNIAIS